jgi:hypothetical protein
MTQIILLSPLAAESLLPPATLFATLFVDISGAFDNVWWPAMIMALRQANIPDYLIALIKSYVTNRKVIYKQGSLELRKECTKGCPQGSVLGPTLWNTVLDMFLRMRLPPEAEVIAYADDIAIVVRTNDRTTLKNSLQSCADLLQQWAISQKLTISKKKTKIRVNKPSRKSHNRDIRTDVGGTKIELVKEIKYLGILLDTKLNFQNHVNQACNRAKKILIALRKKLFKTWNPPVAESLHTIYRCAVVPILAYASEIWSPRLHLSKIKRKIYSVYGLASKIIIGGYSSCSHEAAGLPPLDLALWQVTCKKKLKKEPAANYLDQQIIRSDFENFRQINEYLNLVTLDVWQLRWETSSKGRVTYKFFPTIPSLPRTSLSRLSTQTLTGHGPFQIHLHRIGKSESDACQRCNVSDDPVHRILNCPLFDEDRARLLEHAGGQIILSQLPDFPPLLLEPFARENTETPPPTDPRDTQETISNGTTTDTQPNSPTARNQPGNAP